MPSGLNLGGAFFTLYGDNQQLLQTMAQARAATDQATKAMAAAQADYARAAQATNATVKAMYEQRAKASVALASSESANVKKLTDDLAKLNSAFDATGKSAGEMAGQLKSIGATLATLTGFGAIASGALLVRESFLAVIDAAQKLNQEQFRLQKLFGDLAPMFQKQAKALAEFSGRSLADATAAINTFATVQKQYGVSTAQLIDLQTRSANAAAIAGVSLEESAKRVAPALRGEAESIEYLGFSLQSDYLKSLQDVTSLEYKRWQQMGPMAKTQAILKEFQKQSNEQTGAAAERAQLAAGAIDKMKAAFADFAGGLGQVFNPALVALADVLVAAGKGMAFLGEQTEKMNRVGAEFAKEHGLPAWITAIPIAGEALAVVDGLFGSVAKKQLEMNEAAKEAEADAKAEIAAAAAEQKRLTEAAKEDAKTRVKVIADLEKEARDKAVDAENSMYADKKDALQADKNRRVEAIQATKEAALDAIRVEKQAAEDLYQTRLAHLQKLKDDELQAAEDRHRDAVRLLEAEKNAVSLAAEATQRRIKAEEEANARASQDRLRTIKDQLEAEDRVRDAARVTEDRALADQTERIKRELADRHEAVMEGIEAEEKAVRENAEQATRRIEAQSKKVADAHRKRLDQIEDRKKAAERAYDAAVRQIEDEQKAAEKAHDGAVRQIETEQKAAERAHDVVVRQIETEQKAAEDAHDARIRALDDEANAAEHRHQSIRDALDDELQAAEDLHDGLTRGFEDEKDAAEKAHTTITEGLDDELTLAKQIHDQAMDALDERARAEDDRHRAVTDNQEEELRRQLAFLDATLEASDAELEAEQRKLKIADLQGKLKEAQSSGNAEEVARAERAIADEQLDFQRDTLKDQLKAKRDALVAAGKLAKDQADEEHRLIEQGIKDAKDLADAQLDAVEKSVKARKDAADDQFKLIKDDIDARKKAADDEFDLVKRSIKDRQDAADDELRQVKDVIDAKKTAANDELKLIKDGLDARKLADADQLQAIKDLLDARKIAADDALTKIKDDITARKQALSDEKAARQIVFDDEKEKADEKEKRDKDRLDKAKIRIADERDAALKALEVRKAQEEDDYQDAQRREEDALKEAQRRIIDRRTAEDQAAQDKRKEAEETARVEQVQIHDTADALITASKDALDAYNTAYGLRKEKADDTYNNEKEQIRTTYDDPETGLIPKLKKAYDDTKEWYDKRTLEVNKQYDNERKEIEKTFNDPEHGLFKQLEEIHNKTIDGLKNTKEDWENNFAKPVQEVTNKVFEDINAQFDRLLKGRKIKPEDGDGGDGGGGGGGGGGGPPPRRSGGQYRPIVEDAFDSSYWTDQGTHAGGPAADIFARRGSAIRAPVGGRMESASYPKGGNAGWLYGDDGLVYYFAHANQRMYDGKVDPGDKIGEVGNTGAESTSPHLHFAIGTSDDVISKRDGKGDIWGDSSYWDGSTGTPPGDDEAPGSGIRVKDGYLIFELFGQRYRIKLPEATLKGSALLKAIEQLGKEIGGAEFGRVAAAVADSEGADGDLSKKGTGGARGPFQFDPGGELQNYARELGMDLDEAGDYAGRFPMHAARWALEGYLGKAIKRGQDKEGLSGADLAVYASRHGQRPQEGLEERAGDSYRKLYGYARGGFIPEPTLLVGKTLGPYAVAGEHAPEWVTPQAPAPAEAMKHTTVEMPILIGNREVERLWIDGYNLNVQRGRQFLGTVPR